MGYTLSNERFILQGKKTEAGTPVIELLLFPFNADMDKQLSTFSACCLLHGPFDPSAGYTTWGLLRRQRAPFWKHHYPCYAENPVFAK